ncbi:metal-dependent hydrolase [Pseudoalteromonas luteoviolacea]|nr:metal-dependent hydrolase [Pseudoalteromonas luteoviolacea]TQF70340.1 metal-dependent hydrolase [Pseudoalteromonas luteoviolacea]
MSPSAHVLFSWLASAELIKHRRERILVTLSGALPDLDGIGLIVDVITNKTNFYLTYHHYLGHSIFACLTFATFLTALAKRQKQRVFLLCLIVFHFHILFDVIGSKGPDGYQWPIYYLYPLDSSLSITWSGQWELNAWQNYMFMAILLVFSTHYAISKKITVLEVFSKNLNSELFKMWQKYFGNK